MINTIMLFIAGGSLGFLIAAIVFATEDRWEE